MNVLRDKRKRNKRSPLEIEKNVLKIKLCRKICIKGVNTRSVLLVS